MRAPLILTSYDVYCILLCLLLLQCTNQDKHLPYLGILGLTRETKGLTPHRSTRGRAKERRGSTHSMRSRYTPKVYGPCMGIYYQSSLTDCLWKWFSSQNLYLVPISHAQTIHHPGILTRVPFELKSFLFPTYLLVLFTCPSLWPMTIGYDFTSEVCIFHQVSLCINDIICNENSPFCCSVDVCIPLYTYCLIDVATAVLVIGDLGNVRKSFDNC